MAYTPPTGSAVDFTFEQEYVPPAGSQVYFNMLAVELYAIDVLDLSETITDQLKVTATAADTFGLSGVAAYFFAVDASDALTFSDQPAGLIIGMNSVVDSFALSDASPASKLSNGVAADAFLLSGVANAKMVILVALADILNISGVSPSGDETQESWAVNLVNSAHSRYTSFDFNSYAEAGGKFYGARSDGIYELTGTKDGDDPIEWAMSLPAMDFGSDEVKTVEYVYLGASSKGQTVLRVDDKDGTPYYYTMVPQTTQFDNLRAKPGVGLKQRYWRFELTSPHEIEIESISFIALPLGRRK
jgi:hypothetical protein